MSSDPGADIETLPLTGSTSRRSTFDFHAVTRGWSQIFPDKGERPLQLDATDAIAILFLTALGMITRIFRIQYPPYVVFDEVYFGNFTNWYLSGLYFTDIHPPLAKLIMAGVAHYAGYKGDFNFELLGEGKRYPNMNYVPLRITPAFFGALCVPLTYFSIRAMLCSPFAALAGALLIASDVMLIAEARHILSDGILHFFACLAIFSIFLAERSSSVFLFLFEGLCCGCVAACKYTAGGVVLLALVRQLPLHDLKNRTAWLGSIIRCGFLCGMVGFIHLICFSVHLQVLPFMPDEGASGPPSVVKGLVSRFNPDWEARARAPSMVRRVIDLAIDMHRGNMKIGSSHPYASKWYEWPLATGKWVLYWTMDGKHILCMGNVLLWWPVFGAVLVNIVRAICMRDVSSETSAMLFGYLFSYLPFALVPREMFIYHYAVPLIFGCCNIVVLIDKFLPPRARGFCYLMFPCMAITGFFLWCPWAYGLTTPDFYFMMWNSKWR
jgi:dolichyl-phosphate-mannose--protein O-mannosyl transferase